MSRSAVPTLKARALAYIAQREHSRVELRRKLLAAVARQRRVGEPPPGAAGTELPSAEDIDRLLDWLTANDLISAPRFVETRVHQRSARFGNLRIRHELAQHGLALDPLAATALEGNEIARARAVWARRFGGPAGSAAERARQARFLAARGFSADVVRRVISGIGDDD